MLHYKKICVETPIMSVYRDQENGCENTFFGDYNISMFIW